MDTSIDLYSFKNVIQFALSGIYHVSPCLAYTAVHHNRLYATALILLVSISNKRLAPRDGLEPPTRWLTASCSTC